MLTILLQRLTVILFFSVSLANGQSNWLSKEITAGSFQYEETQSARKTLRLKKRSRYNPFAYAGAGLLFFYQNVLSEQVQASCMYEVSCSEFTKVAIREMGVVEGILRGLNQLTECHAGILYEYPAIAISSNNKINNGSDKSAE